MGHMEMYEFSQVLGISLDIRPYTIAQDEIKHVNKYCTCEVATSTD